MIYHGDCLEILRTLPSESVHCCVTSPPYWGLRDYGVDGQLGLEKSPEEYVARMVDVFREVRRVLRADGTLWLNIGDSYANNGAKDSSSVGGFTGERIRAGVKGIMDSRPREIPIGLKPKDLVGIPWRLAFALQSDGWYLRQDIIWHKPNPMPESVRDRCTKAHEYVFLMSKSARYYWDAGAVKEKASYPGIGGAAIGHVTHDQPGSRRLSETENTSIRGEHRNRRSVWTIATQPCKEAHFAVMPQKLVEPCILAGCPEGGTVLDPFFGAGTVGIVATKLGRKYVGIELNPAYIEIARKRIGQESSRMPLLANA